ncbi:hypothetical protein HK103_005590 [Boothiomyces macroporosus]|uniref:Uncharacterized protein n=1 Tax=Boothiomyces macroporosus TaxID=261099 RepID=A0AAD5UIU5_9FUNG|nr:hypothetical protein HK103_005590 [Boothiomyces macroporosus]
MNQEVKIEIEQYTPRPSSEILRSESLPVHHRKVKVENVAGYDFHEFKIRGGSVVGNIIIPVLVYTLWALVWTFIAQKGLSDISISNVFIVISSTVLGLLLVFRTNTAYDRYWEARKTIWYDLDAKGDKNIVSQKLGAINLIVAFPIACKHHLRDEHGFHYEDLYNLLLHVPDFQPGQYHPQTESVPVEISYHISSYLKKIRADGLMDAPSGALQLATLNSMIDVLSSFQRIVFSPVPVAYSIHLKQIIMIYLLLLPFQIQNLGWNAITITFLAAFFFLGIEAIGHEIENPFGYDPNDLDLQGFCDEIRRELGNMIDRPSKLPCSDWSTPVDLNSFDQLRRVVSTRRAKEQ